MTAEKILQSDILDILFEGRNKLYGAYELRRTYHRRLKHGISGMFLVVAIAVVSYLFGNGPNVNLSNTLVINDTVSIADLTDPATPPKPELPPPPAQSMPPEATIANTAPLIVADLDKTEVAKQTDIDTSAISDITTPGIASTGQVIPDIAPGTPGGDGPVFESIPTAAPTIPTGPIDMKSVDEMPQYPGGTNALVRYMINNLTSELESGVKYVLKAQFVINEYGYVSDAIILNSDEPELNQQVLKAIRKMKQWKPGRLNGRNVAVRFTMPVTFVGSEE